MCVTDHHDMTFTVKVMLNPNTTNQLNLHHIIQSFNLKTQWEKEKMQVASIFSFSKHVLYPIFVANYYWTMFVSRCF